MSKEKKKYTKEKEENTMAVFAKPTNKAFVLNSEKAAEFLKQDNHQFKNVMARFEKITNQKSHSVPKK